MLQIEHLTKKYGEKKAVDDLSLHICPGEIYGFIGHNGAGKTTTIKSCCGILQFEEGDIRINGISVKDDPIACKKKMAYIPDNPDLYEFMTGIQFLNFIADIFEVGEKERTERIRTYGDAFELTGDLGSPISAYSHGMKQKLAIISAWLHEPELIIMDEPRVSHAEGIIKKAVFGAYHLVLSGQKDREKSFQGRNGRIYYFVCCDLRMLLYDLLCGRRQSVWPSSCSGYGVALYGDHGTDRYGPWGVRQCV